MKDCKFIPVIFVICIFSCNNYELMSNEEVRTAFIQNSSANFKGYYYNGSDANFHYFENRWVYMKNTRFKIPVSGLTINEKYKYEFGKSKLAIELVGKNKNAFAKNEFYTLYETPGIQ